MSYAETTIDELVERLHALERAATPVLIGIDGSGGAGKSTLAARLAARLEDAVVVHMDDLYLPKHLRPDPLVDAGAGYDRQRLINDVLRPLRTGGAARYQRYDWDADQLAEWVDVRDAAWVIVEGVTSIADDVRGYYDTTVWVDTSIETCLRRGIDRDGEGMRAQWEQVWLPAEAAYKAAQRPDLRADLVVAGHGDVVVRRLEPSDSMETLTVLLHDAYRPLLERGMRYGAAVQDVDTTRRRCAEGDCFIAELDGELVGTALFKPQGMTSGTPWYDRPECAHWGQFAVRRDMQGRGIGAKLIDAVEAAARAAGVEELGVDTAEHAQELIELYTRRGYRFIEYVTWGHTNYRSIVLSKRLVD